MEKLRLLLLPLLLTSAVASSDFECTLTHGDHYYDLRSLGEKDYWSYEEKAKYKDFNLNFYVSVCHPLRNIPSGNHCSDQGAGVCVEQINKNGSQPLMDRFMKVITPNGGSPQENSLKLTTEGWLEYQFTDGTPCDFHGVETNYTTFLNLLCPTHGAEESLGPVLMSNAACVITFAWLTEAACPVPLEKPKPSTCMDFFNNSDEKLNLHSLHSASFYSASSVLNKKKYVLNICGSIETGPCGGKNATVCDVSNPSSPVVISQADSMKVMWDGPYFSLKYFGDAETESQKNVVIKFLCDRHAHNTTVYFISGNASHLFFAARTTAVCTPKEHECVFKDRKNQVYDLRPLQKKEENWEVLDRREDHRDVLYHINLCGPLNPVGYYSCPPGKVGACQTSLNKHSVYNLGYITSDPVINSDGTITIIYTGGDACQDGKHTRSTRIMMSCDKYAHEPVFIEETSTCEYVFAWQTPFACPRHVVESSTCQIQDPLYGFVYDLTPLRNTTKDYTANDGVDDFHVNVCGPVVENYGDSNYTNSSIVISTASSVLSGGQSPAKFLFNDGTLTMEFLNGSVCEESNTITSQIIFLCDHEMEDPGTGLTVFRHSAHCQTNYVWRTKYACPPHTVIDCSVTVDGYHYDLNPLSMPNLNQEEHGSNHDQKFVLNVCRSVVHSKSSRCAYDAAACLIDESNKNKSLNIGVLGKGPYLENGRLKLKYQNGDKCNATHRYSTEIFFQCDEEDLFPYPHFVGQENCNFLFEWKTKQACSEAVEPSSFGNCTATDVYRNYQYDMSPLKKDDLYEVSNGDVKILLNVCGAVEDDRCPDAKSGACVKGQNQASFTSGGVANAELMVIPGTLTLRYTNGSPCTNGIQATTLISFFCGAEGATEGPVLVSVDYESCTYFINWHTELACEYRVSCFAQGYDRAVDLRPLIQHKSNYEVAVSDNEKFYINVCRPLNHVHQSTCTAGASACRVVNYANGTSTSDSLGKPLMAPVYGHDDSVLILNTLGSQCRTSPTLKYSSRINFVCDISAGKGSPKFLSVTDDCQYLFEWRTVFVCVPNATVDATSCQTRHEPGKTNLDLLPLFKKDGYIVPFSGENYLVNVCGSVCGDSGVCTTSNESYGLSDSVHFKWDYNVLRLTYFSEESCESSISGKRSSSIFFECDMSAGYGRPEADYLMEDTPCMAVFTWRTNITCLESVYADSTESLHPSPTPSIISKTTKSSQESTVAPIVQTTAIPFTNDSSSSRSKDSASADGSSDGESHGISPGAAVLVTMLVLGAIAAGLFYAMKVGLVHRLINRAKMSTATPRRVGMMLLDDTI